MPSEGTEPPSQKQVSKDIKILEAFAHEHIHSQIVCQLPAWSQRIHCSFPLQKLAITNIHCGTDEWSGKFAMGWKTVTGTMLEDEKDLLTNFVLDYVW